MIHSLWVKSHIALGRQMTKDNEKMLTKLVVLLFSSIITTTGWLAKSEITSMATTLKDIRSDVSALNSKALLQEQEIKFKFSWIERKTNSIESRLKTLELDQKQHN